MDRMFKCLGLFSLLVFSSCSSKDKAIISGTITNAKGSTLILEMQTLDGLFFQDSVQITNNNAQYKLKGQSKQYPEFFNLVLNKNKINLIVDSAMNIVVNLDNNDINNYTVEHSETSKKVQKINNMIRAEATKLQEMAHALSGKSQPEMDSIRLGLNSEFNTFKDSLGRYIYDDPKSFVAYFALFQKLFGDLIFDPLNARDFKYYGAVATSFKSFLPNHYRTAQLYEFSNKALQDRRSMEMKAALAKLPPSIPEIALPSTNGDTLKLSAYSGKVTVLYFWSYLDADYATNNMELKKLYSKYGSKGLKIYQVSFDNDWNEWKGKVSAQNLPWTNVCDVVGRNSEIIRLYNIQKLPLLYLIDKNLKIYRGDSMTADELDHKIKELL